MVSFEVFPFAKVGGLADVVGSLPPFLQREGVEVEIFMPYHRIVDQNASKYGYTVEKVLDDFEVPFVQTPERASLYRSTLPGSTVPVYLVKNDHYFSTEKVYGFEPEGEQSIFFTVAALQAMQCLGKPFDIIHANDWQTGLIPVYLKSRLRDEPFFQDSATLFTIHNLGYQGRFSSIFMNFAGLPHYLFNVDALEFYGEVNFLKGGILFADVVTTVSPKYAEEIQTQDYGEKLEGVLSIRSDSLTGILNGIDNELYDPARTTIARFPFSAHDLEGKAKNKQALQQECGLPLRPQVPLVGLVSRLVEQKGLDIFSHIARYFFMHEVQMVVLGTGQPEYEGLMRQLSNEYPQKLCARITFDIDLANLIYAGADMFLMPSNYEPCGLGQMFSLRFGTIPVVHYTGGLADTVTEFNPQNPIGNGFGFHHYGDADLLLSLSKALYFFHKKEQWDRIIQNAMSANFSWGRSAKGYKENYQKALTSRRTA